ncbi:MAG: nucleotidyl transferase AbiEii/AbiGii toxin family protein [Bacteroidota bacterium]
MLQEHFNILDWVDFPFEVENDWFSKQAQIRTYNLNELLGTKLRALHQRSKWRDLFDLDYAHHNHKLSFEEIGKYFRFALPTFSACSMPICSSYYITWNRKN